MGGSVAVVFGAHVLYVCYFHFGRRAAEQRDAQPLIAQGTAEEKNALQAAPVT